MHYLALAVLAIALAGCQDSAIDPDKPYGDGSAEQWRSLLVGKWYSDLPTKDGGRLLELADLRSDGTFTFTFRVISPSGSTREDVETGVWGVDGPIHFTIVQQRNVDGESMNVDLSDAYYYDAYEIIKLDNKVFRYKGFSTGTRYHSERVADDFQLPGTPASRVAPADEMLCGGWENPIADDMRILEGDLTLERAEQALANLGGYKLRDESTDPDFVYSNSARILNGYGLRQVALALGTPETTQSFCEWLVTKGFWYD